VGILNGCAVGGGVDSVVFGMGNLSGWHILIRETITLRGRMGEDDGGGDCLILDIIYKNQPNAVGFCRIVYGKRRGGHDTLCAVVNHRSLVPAGSRWPSAANVCQHHPAVTCSTPRSFRAARVVPVCLGSVANPPRYSFIRLLGNHPRPDPWAPWAPRLRRTASYNRCDLARSRWNLVV